MQHLLRDSIVLMALTAIALPSVSLAEGKSSRRAANSPAIHGELIRIEGNVFTVKAPTGRRQELRIDHETKMTGIYREGEYVQAWVLPDGRAESIIAFREMGPSSPTEP